MSKIRAIILNPKELAYTEEIENNLKSFQSIVGGLIQVVDLADGVCLICNEEGKILDLPENRTLKNWCGDVYDVLCGTCIICGFDEDGEFITLNEDTEYKYFKEYEYPEATLEIGGKIYSDFYDPKDNKARHYEFEIFSTGERILCETYSLYMAYEILIHGYLFEEDELKYIRVMPLEEGEALGYDVY